MNPISIVDKQAVWALDGYVPSPEQLMFHKGMSKIKIAAGGERGGKSKSVAEEMLPYILTPSPKGGYHFHLVGVNFQEARYEFEYILEALRRIDPNTVADVSMPQQNKWKLEVRLMIGGEVVSINTVETISADDPLAIRGFESDLTALCEAGRVSKDVFLRILGRLSSSGGILLVSGTFEGSVGWYPEYWTLGQSPNDMGITSYSIPTWSNLAMFPGGRNDPKILMLERQYPPDVFAERVAATPTPPSDRVHKYFDPHVHIVSPERLSHLDPEAPLYLAVDPGRTHAYAVEVIQKQNDVVYVIDEIYEQNLITSEIIAIAKQRPWWKRVSQSGNVIDIAGTYKEISGPSQVETWRELSGINLSFEASRIDIEDGITKLDSAMVVHPVSKLPNLYISSVCTGLIGELGGGPAKFPDGGVYKRNFKAVPVNGNYPPIDRNNHAVKALSYFEINHYGHSEVTRNRYATKRPQIESPAPMGRYWR